jgi:hypothetical protein
MLARMNFASDLARVQEFNLASAAQSAAATRTPDDLLAFVLGALGTPALDRGVIGELSTYTRATGAWTASPTQVQNKAAGLVHLVAGTAEYQFV